MAAVMALSAGCLGKKIDTRVTFEAEEETEKAKSKKEKSGKNDKASRETMDEAALKNQAWHYLLEYKRHTIPAPAPLTPPHP